VSALLWQYALAAGPLPPAVAHAPEARPAPPLRVLRMSRWAQADLRRRWPRTAPYRGIASRWLSSPYAIAVVGGGRTSVTQRAGACHPRSYPQNLRVTRCTPAAPGG